MSAPNIKNKAVTFNVEDPYQKQLLNHVLSKSKNFSNYIKILIERDMSGVQVQSKAAPVKTNRVDGNHNDDIPNVVGVEKFKDTNLKNLF